MGCEIGMISFARGNSFYICNGSQNEILPRISEPSSHMLGSVDSIISTSTSKFSCHLANPPKTTSTVLRPKPRYVSSHYHHYITNLQIHIPPTPHRFIPSHQPATLNPCLPRHTGLGINSSLFLQYVTAARPN